MNVVNDLKEEVENANLKINSLIKELQSFSDIKNNISSSSESLKEGIENFDTLQSNLLNATEKLNNISTSLNSLIKKLTEMEYENILTKIEENRESINSLEKSITEEIKKHSFLEKIGFVKDK